MNRAEQRRKVLPGQCLILPAEKILLRIVNEAANERTRRSERSTGEMAENGALEVAGRGAGWRNGVGQPCQR